MKKPIYIFNDGKLKRKENTIYFFKENEKKVIPINAISEIHIFGEVDINKRVLEFLTQNKIPLFFYNYYGYYIGTYYPREYLNSGIIIINQARCYLDKNERLFLAKEFVIGAIENILKNLIYYRKHGKEVDNSIIEIKRLYKDLENIEDINYLFSLEAHIRKIYYESFNLILNNNDFSFEKRSKRPPENAINALISFGNTLLYNTVLAQIYHTHLDPRIGYLHESNQRSFSLNLDISEVFKPILVDRVIFSLINRGQIKLRHFEEDIRYSYLNEKGRKIFIKAYEEKLATTITHKNLGKISYKRAIKIECYKLYKHFLLEDVYKPFISNW